MPRGRPTRASVYARLDAALSDLHTRLGGLPTPAEAGFVWRDIWHLEAHHSTALEGNTLVIREVELLLDQGRAVGAKPLKEYMEVKGYADAATWVYSQAHYGESGSAGDAITLTELRQIHATAMGPVWGVAPHPDATEREGPGNFREHDIRPFPGGMTPPSWPLVPAKTQDWLDQTNQAARHLRDGQNREPFPGSTRHPAQRLRTGAPLHRRQWAHRTPGHQLAARPPRLSADHRHETPAGRLPESHAARRRRGCWPS